MPKSFSTMVVKKIFERSLPNIIHFLLLFLFPILSNHGQRKESAQLLFSGLENELGLHPQNVFEIWEKKLNSKILDFLR